MERVDDDVDLDGIAFTHVFLSFSNDVIHSPYCGLLLQAVKKSRDDQFKRRDLPMHILGRKIPIKGMSHCEGAAMAHELRVHNPPRKAPNPSGQSCS